MDHVTGFYQLTIDDIYACSYDQFEWLFPIFFAHLQSKHAEPSDDNGKLWNAFSGKLRSYPGLWSRFYFYFNNLVSASSKELFPELLTTTQAVRDTADFFETMYKTFESIRVGAVYDGLQLADPLHGSSSNLIIRIEVVKVFTSRARPLLLKCTYDNNNTSTMIVKKGTKIFPVDFMI